LLFASLTRVAACVRARRWQLRGALLDSGSNSGAGVSQSELRMVTDLVRAGSVAFTYRVDGEPGRDGLIFTVDDVPWPQGLLSYEPDFRTVRVRFFSLVVIFGLGL
jgi:hypothetical protein